MLYVCSVPWYADINDSIGTQLCIVDVLPLLSNRANIDYLFWGKYQQIFNYSNIWILDSGELAERVVVNIKYHLGET